MSKKKKKKKQKKDNLLFEVDNSLNSQYLGIKDEIEFLQMEWDRARIKCKKKAKKKMKKSGEFYPYEFEMKERKKLIKKMEDSNLLSRTQICLEDFKPICLIIARLIAALIVAILSLDAIKVYLKPETLSKMSKVYELAMSV